MVLRLGLKLQLANIDPTLSIDLNIPETYILQQKITTNNTSKVLSDSGINCFYNLSFTEPMFHEPVSRRRAMIKFEIENILHLIVFKWR